VARRGLAWQGMARIFVLLSARTQEGDQHMATAHTRDDKENHKTRRAKHDDDRDMREVADLEPDEQVEINPLAASVYTVTSANPTPPTNIPFVAYGSPPMAGMVPAQNLRDPAWVPGTAFTALMKPTYSADCALVPTGGQLPNPPVGGQSTIPAAAVATTAIATPVGGSGGTGVVGGSPLQTTGVILVTAAVAEASGTVVVVTAPGSVAAAPTQSISVMGNYTTSPNSSAPSSASQIYTLSPQNLTAAAGNNALTVTGRGFNSGSVVSVAAVAQTTVFVSSTVLTVAAAPKKATPGNQAVIVTTDGVASGVVNWVFV
jgi:hypothetical protein